MNNIDKTTRNNIDYTINQIKDSYLVLKDVYKSNINKSIEERIFDAVLKQGKTCLIIEKGEEKEFLQFCKNRNFCWYNNNEINPKKDFYLCTRYMLLDASGRIRSLPGSISPMLSIGLKQFDFTKILTNTIQPYNIKDSIPENKYTWFSFADNNSFRKWIENIYWSDEYYGYSFIHYNDHSINRCRVLRISSDDYREKNKYIDIYNYGGDIDSFFESTLMKPWAKIKKQNYSLSISDHFKYDQILTSDVESLALRCFDPSLKIYYLKDNYICGKKYNVSVCVDKKQYMMIERYLRLLKKDNFIHIKRIDNTPLIQDAYLIDLNNKYGRYIGNVSYPYLGPKFENAIEINTKDEHKCGNHMLMAIGMYISKHHEILEIRNEVTNKFKSFNQLNHMANK